MSYYEYEYVTVAERRAKALKSLEKLRKKNPDLAPIMIKGRKLARTWWGIAWNDNLESYSDYSNRIGRGRSYIRHGAVLDLKISPGKVAALVQGSARKPYEVDIRIEPLSKHTWETITRACEGKIDSLQELIKGRFPKSLAELFTAQGKGLFPSPGEISLECSCPDWATMCKHIAAVLYGVGTRLDENPALFFVLRNVDIDELVSKVITDKSETLLTKSRKRSSRVIEDDNIADLFGIDMEGEEISFSREAVQKEEGVKNKAASPAARKSKRAK